MACEKYQGTKGGRILGGERLKRTKGTLKDLKALSSLGSGGWAMVGEMPKRTKMHFRRLGPFCPF